MLGADIDMPKAEACKRVLELMMQFLHNFMVANVCSEAGCNNYGVLSSMHYDYSL